MTEEEINAKCDAIRQIAYDLHVYLGVGYLEKSMKTVLHIDWQKRVLMSRHRCR